VGGAHLPFFVSIPAAALRECDVNTVINAAFAGAAFIDGGAGPVNGLLRDGPACGRNIRRRAGALLRRLRHDGRGQNRDADCRQGRFHIRLHRRPQFIHANFLPGNTRCLSGPASNKLKACNPVDST
jgi:hypothetical protein